MRAFEDLTHRGQLLRLRALALIHADGCEESEATWVGALHDAALRAARHLNVLNFGLSVRGPGLDEFVARHAAPVVEWMQAG